MPVSPNREGLHRHTTELSTASIAEVRPLDPNANSGPGASSRASERLLGKHIAMVTFSPYPDDPRPRRAIDAFLKEGATLELVCVGDKGSPKREVLDRLESASPADTEPSRRPVQAYTPINTVLSYFYLP